MQSESTPAAVDDKDLVASAQAGDKQAFEAICMRYRQPLLSFLRRYQGKASQSEEDWAQETFERAFRHLDQYDARWRFSTWLFAIGKHVAIGSKQHREIPAQIEVEELATTPQQIDSTLWRTAQRQLSARDYQVLWYHYGEDMAVAEIAKKISISKIAVKVSLFRSRKTLLAVMQ